MKFQALKKLQRAICLGLAIAFASLNAEAVNAAGTDSATLPPQPPPTTAPNVTPTTKLSAPAREVLKLTSSGVPDDVVKAYIENSPSTFNLTPDNIIEMHEMGISGAVTAAMLGHDQAYRAQANAIGPMSAPPFTAPQPQTVAPDYTYPTNPESTDQYSSMPSDYSDYYDQLSPYGTWNYAPGYGYGWQPYAGLGYNYYPWGLLGFGAWNFCPGFGWCWFPHNHFNNNFGRFHGGFNNFHNFGARGNFAGNHFRAGGFNSRVIDLNHSAGAFHSFGGRGGVAARGGFGGGHMGGGGHR